MIKPEDCWLHNQCNHIDCDSPFCMRLFKLDYLYEQALIPIELRKHRELCLDSTEDMKNNIEDMKKTTDYLAFMGLKELENDILGVVERHENIFISSNICGNGKTSWALKLIQSYFNKIWSKSALTCRALFINVPRFLLALKDNITNHSEYIQHIKDNVLTCDIVVWDEIGTKGLTQFEHEHILNYINARLDSGKTNIYTSNLVSEPELKLALGERLYSRICFGSWVFNFNGADKRKVFKPNAKGENYIYVNKQKQD